MPVCGADSGHVRSFHSIPFFRVFMRLTGGFVLPDLTGKYNQIWLCLWRSAIISLNSARDTYSPFSILVPRSMPSIIVLSILSKNFICRSPFIGTINCSLIMIEMCLVSLAACNTADSFLAQLLLTCLNKLMHKTKHDVFSSHIKTIKVWDF